MKQVPAFVISEFTNPSGEIVFRVSGWSDGKCVRKNFATRADAEAEWQVLEIQRLQAETGIRIAGTRLPGRLYGGVTWNEVVQLVHHYQAGTLDPGTFLLVRQWREAGKASPALMWVGLAFLESVLPVGKRRLLKHLNQALAFVKKYENKAKRRTAVRYADWWKLNALFYILRHPRESCGTRDLRAHPAARATCARISQRSASTSARGTCAGSARGMASNVTFRPAGPAHGSTRPLPGPPGPPEIAATGRPAEAIGQKRLFDDDYAQPDAADGESVFWTRSAGQPFSDDDFVQADAPEAF